MQALIYPIFIVGNLACKFKILRAYFQEVDTYDCRDDKDIYCLRVILPRNIHVP